MLIALQVIIILTCLVIGAHRGGMALGLIAGVGLLILVFAFRLEPGSPPVSVILTILAVIGCAATLQQSGGLDVMMQFAEKILHYVCHLLYRLIERPDILDECRRQIGRASCRERV